MEKDTDYVPAIRWLWGNRNKPFIFGTSVLTEDNRKQDSTTINPPLTPVESENLFQFLERKELLFRQQDGHYIINKVEGHKWKSLISDLKRWDWTRHWFWTAWHKFFAVVFIALVSGWIAAVATKWTENKLSSVKPSVEHPTTQNPPIPSGSNKPNQTKESDSKSNPVIPDAPPVPPANPIPQTTPQ